MKQKTKKQLQEELQEHKKKYIHIPKLSLLPFIGTIFFGLLSYLNLFLLDWEVIKFVFDCELEVCKELPVNTLINLYPIIGEYLLISLFFISLVAMFKGGYKNLKSYDEGLIFGLIGEFN